MTRPMSTSSRVRIEKGQVDHPPFVHHGPRCGAARRSGSSGSRDTGRYCFAAVMRRLIPYPPDRFQMAQLVRPTTPSHASRHMTTVTAVNTATDPDLAPATHLKMVVDGRHAENALAVGQLEIAHLQNDRQRSRRYRSGPTRSSTSGISSAKASAADGAAQEE